MRKRVWAYLFQVYICVVSVHVGMHLQLCVGTHVYEHIRKPTVNTLKQDLSAEPRVSGIASLPQQPAPGIPHLSPWSDGLTNMQASTFIWYLGSGEPVWVLMLAVCLASTLTTEPFPQTLEVTITRCDLTVNQEKPIVNYSKNSKLLKLKTSSSITRVKIIT